MDKSVFEMLGIFIFVKKVSEIENMLFRIANCGFLGQEESLESLPFRVFTQLPYFFSFWLILWFHCYFYFKIQGSRLIKLKK
jgi:hypothetical protein